MIFRFPRLTVYGLLIVSLVFGSIAAVELLRRERHTVSPKPAIGTPKAGKASRLDELLALSPSELESIDVALMNLLCAEGLPGAEGLNVEDSLRRLDGIAKRVESETTRHHYKFRERPEEFNHSEGYFRMLLMAVVLQEDLGITYNPERVTEVGNFEPNDVFFGDSRDIFIHGLIAEDRRLGTCSSLPVLYVSIGRRLGYPLKLVPTQNHLFVRWEDSRERFNVDATGRGMNMYDDNHYRQWPFLISREEEREFGYLRSMTSADELSAFLGLRGHCLIAAKRLQEGLEAHEQALRLCPNSRIQELILAKVKAQLHGTGPSLALLPPELEPYWTTSERRGAPENVPGVGSNGFPPPLPNPLARISGPN